MRTARSRRGFVLLAVLWMLAGGAVLGTLFIQIARDAQGAAGNRIALARARWSALGCSERARAVADDAMQADGSDSAWMRLDRALVGATLTKGCSLSVVPVGLTLDVSTASEAQLQRLFTTAGLSVATSDSLTAALLDWQDTNDERRHSGAEREWYDRANRMPPRNAVLSSRAELEAIRGMELHPEASALLGVESGRILLARAPLPVIATIPGVTTEVISLIAQQRAAGDSAMNPSRLVSMMTADARVAGRMNVRELADAVASTPDGWLIRTEAFDGSPLVSASLELRVVRSGRRVAILRRRSDS
jgi:type II secretory pathway component PulK